VGREAGGDVPRGRRGAGWFEVGWPVVEPS
jgi:hypothetical protein